MILMSFDEAPKKEWDFLEFLPYTVHVWEHVKTTPTKEEPTTTRFFQLHL